jgi:hypothetical protein
MRRLPISIFFSLVAAGLVAQEVDVPLANWAVPPYRQASSGITTMTDVTNPAIFVGVAPCRLADTRGINGFSGQAGGAPLSSFVNRNFQISGSPGGVPAPPNGCAAGTIPAGTEAVSIQFTVVTPTAAGNLVAWQAGGSTPSVSVLNWDTGTVAQGSGTIVPLGAGGAITVRLNTAAAGATAHLVIDVNGYFGSTLGDPFRSFGLVNNSGNATAYFENQSSSCSSGCAVEAFSYSSGQGKAIAGRMNYIGDNSAGVWGGWGNGLTALVLPSAGVRGENQNIGVLGISNIVGAVGTAVAGNGAYLAEGYLGYHTATLDYGVFSAGRTGASGTKSFVDPHPTDASKVIRYISLEGNEPGTYFRGRGKFQRGTARIAVPEDFRLVTDAEGLTVQITPIGALATVAVLRMGLDEIVAGSSRDVEFSYLVQGIRKTYADVESPIAEGTEFMPRSPDDAIPASLSAEQKRRLIRNGTYREDGTVNLETARRLGWDRVWAERERAEPVRQPD